ncbi:MAG: glycosyltransferase family 4 protein, partial [bacterium]
CDRMAEKASAAGVQPINQFRTVYSGMELEPFLNVPASGRQEALQRKEEHGFEPDTFVFGKIARLFHLKGHQDCLTAFERVVSEYPRARLLLVGDGILREELEDRVREANLEDKVVFTGLVPYHRIPDMLTAMDCLVHFSFREGLARVIPQAQAAGRPAISYAIDGAPEAIDHRETGMLVKPHDVAGMENAMIEVMTDSQLRESMVERARSWVEPRFHWMHMAESIMKSYLELPGIT